MTTGGGGVAFFEKEGRTNPKLCRHPRQERGEEERQEGGFVQGGDDGHLGVGHFS